MSISDRLIKRYGEDEDFHKAVNKFCDVIQDSDNMQLRDFINAVKLAEYKNDLYQSGEGGQESLI